MQPEGEVLTERQVAAYLNMSVGVLHKWRRLDKGPTFVKIGRVIRYKWKDVEAWLDSCSGLP
jgi:predicted DNA-binding transcriptional regulator AlpA